MSASRCNGGGIMVQVLTREYVDSFRRARRSRDAKLIEPFLDDNIDWLLTGPVELMGFCGQRRGKAEVLDALTRQHPAVLSGFTVDIAFTLIDRDRVASLSRLTGIQRTTGRTISYNQAQFMRFRGGRIFEYRGIIDSFSAAEQMIGHPIALSDGPCEIGKDRVAV
jgi:ketosteroid isomerase-like protein